MFFTNKKTQVFIYLFTIIFVIILDFFSKRLALYYLSEISYVQILPVLNLKLIFNHGISFGMFSSFENANLILTITNLTICVLILYLSKDFENCLITISYGLILGGALGNIIDRLTIGAVIDFIEFHYQDYYFPTFNIADSSIFIGVVLMIFETINTKKV